MQIEIDAARLRKALRERVERTQGRGVRAMGFGCQVIEAEAKERAPVDTGLLRRSITHRIKRDGADLVGQVGTNVHYAIHVEYGYRTRKSKRAVGKIRYVAGRYFLAGALKAKRNQAIGAIIETLMKGD